jgi:hypothetical protein
VPSFVSEGQLGQARREEAGELTRYLASLPLAPAKHDSLKGGEEYAPGIFITEANGDYTAQVSIEAADMKSGLNGARSKLDTLLISVALRGVAFHRVRDGAKESIRPVEPSKHPTVIRSVSKVSGHIGRVGMPDELVRAAAERHSDLPPRVRRALELFHLGITAQDKTVSFFLCHASLESLASEDPPAALKTAVPDTTQRKKLVEAIEHLLTGAGLNASMRKRMLDHLKEAHATSPLGAFEQYLQGIGQNASKDALGACRDLRNDIAHGKPVKPDTEFHRLRVKLRSWLRAALTHEVSQRLGVTADRHP